MSRRARIEEKKTTRRRNKRGVGLLYSQRWTGAMGNSEIHPCDSCRRSPPLAFRPNRRDSTDLACLSSKLLFHELLEAKGLTAKTVMTGGLFVPTLAETTTGTVWSTLKDWILCGPPLLPSLLLLLPPPSPPAIP